MKVPTSLLSFGSGPSFQRLLIPLSMYSFSSPRVFQTSWEGQVLLSGESLLPPCSLLSWTPPWRPHPILKIITLDSSGLPLLRVPNVNDDAQPLAAKPLAVDTVPCIGNVMCSVWGRSSCSIYLIVALCPESCLILDLLKYETGWCWGHSALESNFIRN